VIRLRDERPNKDIEPQRDTAPLPAMPFTRAGRSVTERKAIGNVCLLRIHLCHDIAAPGRMFPGSSQDDIRPRQGILSPCRGPSPIASILSLSWCHTTIPSSQPFQHLQCVGREANPAGADALRLAVSATAETRLSQYIRPRSKTIVLR
jgi:hypothetical protein